MHTDYLEITKLITTLAVEVLNYFKPSGSYKREMTIPACAICFNALDNPVIILRCKHEFHSKCIKKLIEENCENQKCPICKISINERN